MCSSDIFVSLEDAAVIIGTTTLKLLLMLKNGAVKGRRANDIWLIDKKSLLTAAKPGSSDYVSACSCSDSCRIGCRSNND